MDLSRKLSGKTAIITGAGSGIGKAIAVCYAEAGAAVVASDRDMDSVVKTVEEITGNGGKAVSVRVDVSLEEDIQSMFAIAMEKFGTVDIVVNNAGIMDNFVPAEEVTDELWERVFAVNTTSVMRAIRQAIPIFIKQGKGVIINIISVGGLYGSRAGLAYTASKHAVSGITKNVGYQYAPLGIRCNAIAPGAVETNIGATITAPNEFGMGRAMSGIGLNPRTGKPEEIAAAALFLASEESSFINGTILKVDGGWTAY